jgi:hypothetical protein
MTKTSSTRLSARLDNRRAKALPGSPVNRFHSQPSGPRRWRAWAVGVVTVLPPPYHEPDRKSQQHGTKQDKRVNPRVMELHSNTSAPQKYATIRHVQRARRAREII